MARKAEVSLETSFGQLEEIVTKLENDDLTLEETFDWYQKGMKLVQTCSQSIDKVEKKLIILEKRENEL